ncbi:MAG: prepilin-type N-terminal cleavage/methylation domain-containing protein [Gammaproteobacteria bacterium]|nr:prepilin-type N-terminal cleavage/methylation domain-containing protein [Gammaproteobacteria bacterium]MDH5735990.1 prepilin-type N-terminal cleavage/methylation domain-containing protein [Gammaproteobacteria bacterium]
MKKQQSGFTLIEIAIVLVIIGLLLGGVLKGQEMMTNAKIKRGVNDYNGMSAAIFSYLDRYSALPGDDPNANGRWASVAPTNGTLGDGIIAGACTSVTNTDETAAVIENLRQSGLVSGTGYAKPNNAFTGVICIEDGGIGTTVTTTITGTMVCMNQVEGKIGEILDLQLDDGVGDTGEVQNANMTGGAQDATYAQNGLYWVCRKL